MVCDEPVAAIRSEPFPKMKFVPANSDIPVSAPVITCRKKIDLTGFLFFN